MKEQTFILEFEGVPKADANRYAMELQDLLRSATKEATVKPAQAAANTQDFGATLIIGILGTPAAIVLAKKIGDYLLRRTSATVTIRTESGEMVVQNLGSKDAAELAEKWLDKVQKA
jgi:hypothetical protein